MNITPDMADRLIEKISSAVITRVSLDGKLPGEQESQDALIAMQLLRDHADGKIDINTWADALGIAIVWRTISAFDTTGVAKRIEDMTDAHPDADVPELVSLVAATKPLDQAEVEFLETSGVEPF